MSGKRMKAQELSDRQQALALRQIQVWVQDVRSAAFRREAHRQSLAVAKTGRAQKDQAFIDAASEWKD